MTTNRLTLQLLNSASTLTWQRSAAPDGSGSGIRNRFGFNRAEYMVLEPRVMFDGAMAETWGQETDHFAEHIQTGQSNVESGGYDLLAALSEPSTLEATVQLHEIAFIDASLEDVDSLVAAMGPNVEVHILNPARDGVEQMAEILSSRQDISAIHILAHGRSGTLEIGTATLTSESIATVYSDDLSIIKQSLSANSDVLIYGCDFASGSSGAVAVEALAAATGADVAASDDLTGAAALGGDWVLEDASGLIETQTVAALDWQGLLAVPVANNDSFVTRPGIATIIDPRTNDTDVDGDAISVSAIIDPQSGVTLALNTGVAVTLTSGTQITRLADGTLSVVQPLTIQSRESFIYQITAGAQNATATVMLDRDSDGDALSDLTDSDDDNDGLSDIAEGANAPSALSGLWTIAGQTATYDYGNGVKIIATTNSTSTSAGAFIGNFSTGQMNPVGDDVGAEQFWSTPGVASHDSLQGAFSFGSTVTFQFVDSVTGAPVTVENPIIHLDRIGGTGVTGGGTGNVHNGAVVTLNGGLTWTRLGGTLDFVVGSTTATDSSIGTANGQASESDWGAAQTASGTVRIVGAATTMQIMFPAGPSGEDAGNVLGDGIEFVFEASPALTDSDGDGSFDHLDVDSDNDGILDSVEGTADTDADGVLDRMDIDSDNDGITDSIEAQSTIGYIAPSDSGAAMVDANNDGLDDNFGFGLTPIDSDSDSTPDYRDLDSDNDGRTDNQENGLGVAMVSGLSTAANDADGDGLFNVYETAIDGTVNDGFVVSEGITNPLTTPNSYLPDGGADAALGVPLINDLDYRDADTDNDGIVDSTDIDDDNDGVLDTNEMLAGATGTNGDPDMSTLLGGGTANIAGVNVTVVTSGTVNSFAGDGQLAPGAHLNPGFGATTSTITYTFSQPISSFTTTFEAQQDEERITFSQPASSVTNVLNSTYGVATPIMSQATLENGGLELRSNLTGDFGSNTSQSFGSDSIVTWSFATAVTSLTITHTGVDRGNGILTGAGAPVGATNYNGTIIGGAFSITPAGTDVDSDADGVVNRLDIDADNDGITDNVEAQTTAGYIAPSGSGALMGDADSDGLDDAYDATNGVAGSLGLTPANTDGIDAADYLDADSDNDGLTDIAEAGHGVTATAIAASADADGDGLKDVVESGSVADGFDVNDENLDPANTNFNLVGVPSLAADGSNAVPLSTDLLFRDVNDPPLADDELFTTDEDTTSLPIDLLAGDTDLDGDSLTVESINGTTLTPGVVQTIPVTNGTVHVSDIGVITFTPAPNYNGPISFDYIVSDGNGGTDTGTVHGTVIGMNDLPDAVDDTGTVSEDGPPLSGHAITGPGEDTDSDGDVLTVAAINGEPSLVGQSVEGSTGGTFVINPDGSFSFDPGLDFQNLNVGESRDTALTYRVSDGNGGFDTTTITITVTGSNDAPVALGPIAPVDGVDGEPLPPISTATAFNNPAGDPLTFTATGLPDGITIVPATGVISGTLEPDASLQGPYVVNVTATLPDGSSVTIPLVINITNPAPLATDDGTQTPLDTPVTIAVLGNDTDPDGDDLTLTAVGTPVNGTVVINPDGTLTYTPDAGFTGTDSFTYTINDGQGGVSTATVIVNVGAPDGVGPVAIPLLPESGIDGSPILPIDVAIAFADPNGDPLTFTATGLPPGLSIDPDTGVIIGTLPPDASIDGPYTVLVTGTDPDGNQVTVPLVITITNPAPLAEDDGVATPLDTAVVISTLMNDADPDSDPIHVSATTPPANGTVTINPDGTLTYAPDTGFTGTDTFTYTLSDGQGGSDTATVTVTVGVPSPTVPTATGPIPDQTGIDGLPITPVDLFDFMVDPNGDPLTFTATGLPAGLAIDPATGIVSGTPFSGASVDGPYTVIVTATDPDGNQVTIPVIFSITNPVPAAGDDSVATPQDAAVTIGVLANDSDPDGDPLTVTSTTAPTNGTVTINPDGSILYTPDAGYNGPDSFTYTISDGQGGTTTATVNITVGPSTGLGTDPVIDPITGTDGEPIAPVVVTNAFADPDASAVTTLSVDEAALPPGISFDPLTGTFTGTPTNAASQGSTPGEPPGTYIVPVKATDEHGVQVTQYVTFIIGNLPPVAVADAATVSEDGPELEGNVLTGAGNTITGSGVDFDTAPDNDPLIVSEASQDGAVITIGSAFTVAGGGTLTLNEDGSYTFDPGTAYNNLAVGAEEVEAITYTISDAQGGTSSATLTITVTGVNDSPVIIDPLDPGTPENPIEAADPDNIIPDVTTSDSLTPPTIAVSDYVVDPEGDTLTYTATGLPPGLSLDPDTGLITGTLPANASQGGPDNDGIYPVSITIDDGNGGITTTTITYTIGNPGTDAVNDVGTVTEDVTLVVPVGEGLLLNDTDPDGDTLTITTYNVEGLGDIEAGSPAVIPDVGTLTINPDGSYSFDPMPNFDGAIPAVTYMITDGEGSTDTATLTLTMEPVNDPPVIIDPLNPGTPLNPIGATDPDNIIPDVTTSDSLTPPPIEVSHYVVDPEGDTLTYTATGLPPGLTLDPATGIISGTLPPDASQGGPNGDGVYLVIVTINDGEGNETTTTITYTIGNPSPVAANDANEIDEDTVATGNVLPNDSDPDGDPLVISAVSGGFVGQPIVMPYGTMVLNADGTYTFTPNDKANALPVGEVVTQQVTYTVSDGNGGNDTATLTITITGTNDVPVAEPLPDHGNFEGDDIVIDLSGFFSDPDGDPLTFAASGLPPGLTIDPLTGIITGTVSVGAATNGPYLVTVTVSDGNGGLITMTFTYVVDVVPSGIVEPPATPGVTPPLVESPMPEINQPVTETISQVGSVSDQRFPDFGKNAVGVTVDMLSDLNGTGFDPGKPVITQLVEWLGKQGKAGWMGSLLQDVSHHPYIGQTADLALSHQGEDVLTVKTLRNGNALFVGVDERHTRCAGSERQWSCRVHAI